MAFGYVPGVSRSIFTEEQAKFNKLEADRKEEEAEKEAEIMAVLNIIGSAVGASAQVQYSAELGTDPITGVPVTDTSKPAVDLKTPETFTDIDPETEYYGDLDPRPAPTKHKLSVEGKTTSPVVHDMDVFEKGKVEIRKGSGMYSPKDKWRYSSEFSEWLESPANAEQWQKEISPGGKYHESYKDWVRRGFVPYPESWPTQTTNPVPKEERLEYDYSDVIGSYESTPQSEVMSNEPDDPFAEYEYRGYKKSETGKPKELTYEQYIDLKIELEKEIGKHSYGGARTVSWQKKQEIESMLRMRMGLPLR